jgi:signal transduction histidine kinase
MEEIEADWAVINKIYAEAKVFFGSDNYERPVVNFLSLLSLTTKSTRTVLLINRAGEDIQILDGLRTWRADISDSVEFLPLLYQSFECTRILPDEVTELQNSIGLKLDENDIDGAYFAFENGQDSIFLLFFRDAGHGTFTDTEFAYIKSFSTVLSDQIRFSIMAEHADDVNTQFANHRKRQSIWLEALAWLNEVNVSSLNEGELVTFYKTALFQLKMLVLAENAVAYKVDGSQLLEIASHDAEDVSAQLKAILKSDLDWREFRPGTHHKLDDSKNVALQSLGIKSVLVYPLFSQNSLGMVLCVGKSVAYDGHEEMVATLFAEGVEHIIERMYFLRSIREQNTQLMAEKEEQQKLIGQLKEAQEQLMQQEKMASIGQLAAGVAHEINNPVGYVNSNINALEAYIKDFYELFDVYAKIEKRLPKDHSLVKDLVSIKQAMDFDFIRDDVKDLISESKEGVLRVKQIVKDLKDFSHVDQAEWQLTDISKGIDSTLNIVHSEIKYKAVVHKEYNNIPKIECVPSQINQVIMNLLVNASHAIEGRGDITIRVSRQDEDFVCVQVQDTGKGIKPEDLSHIFNPFFTTKPVGQGTGLGLSLSYSIIENHGGELSVTSELGVGTTFSMVIPIHQKEQKLDV